jgi:nanoRNase/pAp phosphatase (c-di-AMP/oligoRNAs hydrolase)
MTFESIKSAGHDALLTFCWLKDKWRISLYHAEHRKDIDLSVIAVKYGGGGHKGACGFHSRVLPFQMIP